MIDVQSIDHLVLVVANVAQTCDFYEKTLGMQAVEQQPGKWSLKFGYHKISLQSAGSVPEMARGTTVGSGNFCVLTETPIEAIVEHLRACNVPILEGPSQKVGATGPLMSVYFHDPDGNLVEVSNQLAKETL